MKVSKQITVAAFLWVTGTAAAYAQAATTSVFQSGSYSVSGTTTTSACTLPEDEGTEAESFTLDFQTVESGSVVIATGTGTSSEGDTVSIILDFAADGTFLGGAASASGSDFTTSASVVSATGGGSSFEIVLTGAEFYPPSDSCNFDAVFQLAGRFGAQVEFDPESTNSIRVVTPVTLQRQVTTVVSRIFKRVGAIRRGRATGATPTADGFMLQGGSGANAGDGFTTPLGGWLTYGYADYENDFGPLAFDGSRHSGLGGIDFNPFEGLIVGLAAGYESANQQTFFNRGEISTDGFTITPYLGYRFSDTVSVDFAMGYSGLTTDQFRTSPSTGNRLSSEVDSDRWFWGGGLNAVEEAGNWYLTGTIGITWAREFQDAYTETDEVTGATLDIPEQRVRFGQWRVGGEAAYAWGDFEPYVSATYQRDYSTTEIVLLGSEQPENDLDDIYLATGLRYYGRNNLSAYVEYTRIMTRADYVENGVNLLVRMAF